MGSEALRQEIAELRALVVARDSTIRDKETVAAAVIADAQAVERRHNDLLATLTEELTTLRQEVQTLRQANTELRDAAAARPVSASPRAHRPNYPLPDSFSWRLAIRLQDLRHRFAPVGSRRGRLWQRVRRRLDRRQPNPTPVRTAAAASPATTPPGGTSTALRIVIAGPPKAGNTWLKCLLATAYGLRWLPDARVPAGMNDTAFRQLVDSGDFPPGTIFHQHFRVSEPFLELASALPCYIVTIIRDPYDLFVSLYHHIQMFRDGITEQDPRAKVIDKPIDHPDVLHFLEHTYRETLVMANDWVQSQGSIVVRYEDLIQSPVPELVRITNRIRPLEPRAIERAVEQCSADNMRQMSRAMARHVRVATIGEGEKYLNEEHFTIFRSTYGDLIAGLGYVVR